MVIKAIETRYKGYRFRSRLEARWAVFFDALGYEWQYEVEGYQKDVGNDEGERTICYLPDFYLPKSETWVEVKGGDEALAKDSEGLEEFLDYDCPLPGFTDSARNRFEAVGKINGLLILGDIPEPSWGLTFHRIVQHSKGLIFRWALFGRSRIEMIDEDALDFFWNTLEDPDWTTRHRFVSTPRAYDATINGYRAARSARFEHGETP